MVERTYRKTSENGVEVIVVKHEEPTRVGLVANRDGLHRGAILPRNYR